jgi:hypothetical protein
LQCEDKSIVSGIFALTSSESKRLIAKGVVAMTEVKRVLQKGRLVIANGTTNAFVIEEILGNKVPKGRYSAGIVTNGALQITEKEDRFLPFVLEDGQISKSMTRDVLEKFEAGDVFIKGANAIDPYGNAGIFMASANGGTIGTSLGFLAAAGALLIVPVGLEKMIPDVIDASRKCGIGRLKYALDWKVGLMPLVNATVITEIEALAYLTGVVATHVGSGGFGGSEGAVSLVIEGTDEQVSQTLDLVKSIKGEPPVWYKPGDRSEPDPEGATRGAAVQMPVKK